MSSERNLASNLSILSLHPLPLSCTRLLLVVNVVLSTSAMVSHSDGFVGRFAATSLAKKRRVEPRASEIVACLHLGDEKLGLQAGMNKKVSFQHTDS